MKAIVKNARERGAVFQEVDIPKIGRTEMLVKVKASALCRSDVDVYEWTDLVARANYDLPFVMGHEFAGEIVALGEDVTGFAIGDRIAGETHIPCGYCDTCRTGNQHICGNGMGVLGRTADGCFAEYIALDQKSAIKLPDNVTYKQGAILEPFATAMHALSKVQPTCKSLLICGAGTIGQMAVALAKFMGCTKLIVMDGNDNKLEDSKKRGADIVINGRREDMVEIVKRETGGIGVDAVIDFTGSQQVINQIVEVIKIAGTICYVGMIDKGLTFDNFMYGLVYKEVVQTGIFGRRMYDTWREVMNVLETGKIDLDSFIAGEMKLEDFDEAINNFRKNAGRILFVEE